MNTLFVNAAFRDGSRTIRLARHYLEALGDNVVEVNLGTTHFDALDSKSLARYTEAVVSRDYSDSMFDAAKQFAAADEIVIAAPYWNNSIPAALHDYLELVCSQGVSFDILSDGSYKGLCKAEKLVFITTAGGPIPKPNCAFDYVASLAYGFWHIPEVVCYQAENLDQVGCDVEAELQKACSQIDNALIRTSS